MIISEDLVVENIFIKIFDTIFCGCQTFGPFGLKIPMQLTKSRVGWRFFEYTVSKNTTRP